jgi:hypothetical protein
MPSPLRNCPDCGKKTYSTRCRPCFNRERLKRHQAGQPWKRRNDDFGARSQYQNTTVSDTAKVSWWTNANREGFTDTAFAEVERMKLSTFGQTISAVLTDV